MELKDEINKKRKEQWYELIFYIEALALDREVVESSLKEHVKNIEKSHGIFVYETKFNESKDVVNPMKGIDRAFSQSVKISLFAKDLYTTITAIMLFGPSAVEIIGPTKRDVTMNDVQNIANNVASLVHQFAAAGVGGVVLNAPQKK